MAVEAAELTPIKSIVGGLGVSVVRDDAVVSCLWRLVRGDDGANILAPSALWHASWYLSLHLCHALLCLSQVYLVVVILIILSGATTDHSKEHFALLLRSWAVRA